MRRLSAGAPRAGALALGLLLLLATSPAPAAGASTVRLQASVNGRDVEGAAANNPLRLRGQRPATVEVKVFNGGPDHLVVRSIRLSGQVLGLTFFSYETRVDMEIPPGASDQRRYEVDLADLADQATGLLPSRLTVLGQDRHELVGLPFVAEVDGSLSSVYGVFGLAVAAITALLLAGAVLRLATGRLPVNRWRRGVRFGTAGLGVGLTATFSLSALNILTPAPTSSFALACGAGAGLFALGYMSPTPQQTDERHHPDTPTTLLTAPAEGRAPVTPERR